MKKFLERLGSSYAFAALEAAVLVFLLAVIITGRYSKPVEASQLTADTGGTLGHDTESDISGEQAGYETVDIGYVDIPMSPVSVVSVPGGAPGDDPAAADEDRTDIDTYADKEKRDVVMSAYDLIREAPLSARTAQLVVAVPEDLSCESRSVVAGRQLKAAFTEKPVGGFILSADNYVDGRQFIMFADGLDRLSREVTSLPVILLARADGSGPVIGDIDALAGMFEGSDDDDPVMTFEIVDCSGAYAQGTVMYRMSPDGVSDISVADISEVPDELADETAVALVADGADLLIASHDRATVCEALLRAAEGGVISEERLNDALLKIISIKFLIMG